MKATSWRCWSRRPHRYEAISLTEKSEIPAMKILKMRMQGVYHGVSTKLVEDAHYVYLLINGPYSQSPDRWGPGEILPYVLPGHRGPTCPLLVMDCLDCLAKPGAETWYVLGCEHGFPQSEYAHRHASISPMIFVSFSGRITLISA
jgi:hypothetical protein